MFLTLTASLAACASYFFLHLSTPLLLLSTALAHTPLGAQPNPCSPYQLASWSLPAAYLIPNPYFKTFHGPQFPERWLRPVSSASANTTPPSDILNSYHTGSLSFLGYTTLPFASVTFPLPQRLFHLIPSFDAPDPFFWCLHAYSLSGVTFSRCQIPLLQALKDHIPFL